MSGGWRGIEDPDHKPRFVYVRICRLHRRDLVDGPAFSLVCPVGGHVVSSHLGHEDYGSEKGWMTVKRPRDAAERGDEMPRGKRGPAGASVGGGLPAQGFHDMAGNRMWLRLVAGKMVPFEIKLKVTTDGKTKGGVLGQFTDRDPAEAAYAAAVSSALSKKWILGTPSRRSGLTEIPDAVTEAPGRRPTLARASAR